MKDKMKLSVNNREGTLIITIAVIFVAMCILKGELFYARSNIEAIFSNLAYDLLLACGMTFVIILGGVDLSVGAVLALSGIICTLMIQKGINIVLAVGLGILFGGAIGAVNGILVSKANVAPFVATLGSQSICRGACYVLTSGYFVAGLTDAYTNIGRGSLLGVPNKILVSITIMLLLALLSRRFRPLRSMFYVGGNRQAAFISGIPSGLTIILGYMISGLMAGIAAILMTSSLGMGHAGYGISFEMKAISAAVIGGADMHGGAGSFLGTALGVIVVALVNNVFIMFNGSPNWSSAISGLMLLAAVAFDALRRRRKPR
ncbi:ABC transporter permease [Enterocloster bolteae]|uniref:ABC transporter permease n=1 Tax=Enterocloster bolteae TaxID=208479 RepID=UPI002A7F0EFB|nr:ABC transporter permease [Enterocloster bolteae]